MGLFGGVGRLFGMTEVQGGLHLEHDGPMAVELLEGDTWTEVARYGSSSEAGEALDEQVAEGKEPNHLRLRAIDE